jgi:hypothetical protein
VSAAAGARAAAWGRSRLVECIPSRAASLLAPALAALHVPPVTHPPTHPSTHPVPPPPPPPRPRRRIAFVGSDGRTRHFLLQTGQNSSQGHADERLLQLMRLANALLERAPDARRRGLAWHTPAIVPVWPQLRLLEEEPSYASYYEAYEVGASGRLLGCFLGAFRIFFGEAGPRCVGLSGCGSRPQGRPPRRTPPAHAPARAARRVAHAPRATSTFSFSENLKVVSNRRSVAFFFPPPPPPARSTARASGASPTSRCCASRSASPVRTACTSRWVEGGGLGWGLGGGKAWGFGAAESGRWVGAQTCASRQPADPTPHHPNPPPRPPTRPHPPKPAQPHTPFTPGPDRPAAAAGVLRDLRACGV